MQRIRKSVSAVGAALVLAVTGTSTALVLGPASASAGIFRAPAASSAAAPAFATSGGWRVPYRSHAAGTGLRAIVAPGRKDAWAFGLPAHGSSRAVALHWQGSRWHAVHVPQAGGFFPSAAAASSPDNVWVLGSNPRNGNFRVLRWDGHTWSVVPTPPDFSAGNPAVISKNNVWAIGESQCTFTGKKRNCATTLWHWTGSGWLSRQVKFDPTGLAAASADDVWIVGTSGYNSNAGPAGKLVAYRWNGTSFRSVPGIPDRRGAPHGTDVTVGSASNVWVGNRHWNGKRWRTLRFPHPGRGVLISSPTVLDGHGGVWFGPFAHWTGRQWVDTFPAANSLLGRLMGTRYGISILAMARIPGTRTILAAGALSRDQSPARSITNALIAAH